MERELWTVLVALAERLDAFPQRGLYKTGEVLAVYLWAVVHDRPTNWAVEDRHWPPDLKRWLPSQSTMSRRLRDPRTAELLTRIEQHFCTLHVACQWIRIIDGKPLPVGGNSKDADARFGRGAGTIQKGYKLHAVWGGGPLPLAWSLASMDISEKTMARDLIRDLPSGGYLLADSEYDCTALYDLADEAGYQLVAKKRWKDRIGLGHRRQSPHRLRSIALLQSKFGKAIYQARWAIERNFGNWTSFGGGLAPLPAWVRRFPRVRTWIYAKLLVNAARICFLHWPQLLAIA